MTVPVRGRTIATLAVAASMLGGAVVSGPLGAIAVAQSPDATLPSAGPVQAGSPPTSSMPVDTSGWVEQSMPFLGYTVLLPPGFERVSGDPDQPVPSTASIVDRDPQTGQALSAAAQRIHDNGGLFDALGLWSVDPVTLMQLGVIAGEPYRIDAAQLRGIVEQSVAERQSDLGDPVIQAISVPAGTGYLAVYLDAVDLAQHREVHLRTPTGRYLILATTLPDLADPTLEGTVLAIADSLHPIRGSAADIGPPPDHPEDAADPGLEATLPDHIAGFDLTRRSLTGESLVSSVDSVTGTIVGELGRLVNAPGDVTVALAVPTDTTAPLLVAGYRLRGVTSDAAQRLVDSFPDDVWSDTRLAGRLVRTSVRGDGGNRTWLHVAAGPGGDAVLYQVDAGTDALGRAAVAALP